MIVHMFTEDKFTKPYIEFINENFDSSNHFFYVIGNGSYVKDFEPNNIEVIEPRNYNKNRLLIKRLKDSKKIILHGIFNNREMYFLMMHPKVLKKCNWVIWGSDLYCHINTMSTKEKIIDKYVRKSIIKRIAGIITHVEGDYKLACKWYGTRCKYYPSFAYTSNLYKAFDCESIKHDDNVKYVQVGNSADPSNNHIEIFNKLKEENDIVVFAPLAYGDIEYSKEVIKKGKEIFGDRFEYIDELIPFDEYLKYLSKIDVAIFNHNRQQAMGNITTLLGLGKKVYIRDNITSWDFYNKLGIKLWPSNALDLKIKEDIEEDIKKENIKKIKEYFSVENLKKQQEYIFED